MPKVNQVVHHANSTSFRTKNRNFLILKPTVSEEILELRENQNLIHIKSMVSEVGAEPGVIHKLTHNGKCKESIIGLSDQALFDLWRTLGMYFENQHSIMKDKQRKQLEEDLASLEEPTKTEENESK